MELDKLERFSKEFFKLGVVAGIITFLSIKYIYPELGLSREYPIPFRILDILSIITYFIYRERGKTWKDFGLRKPKNWKAFFLPFIFCHGPTAYLLIKHDRYVKYVLDN